MERRTFLASTVGSSLLAGTAMAQRTTPEQGTQPELYLWRQYVLRTGTQPRRLGEFLEKAAVPALNRLGHKPIGVFEVVAGPASPGVFVLTPVATADRVVGLDAAISADTQFTQAAAGYLEAASSDPIYVRQEASLLRAFPNVPRVEVPAATASNGPRLFELRTYESHSEPASVKKMEMFTKMGEMEIFRRVGLTPVFFARTLVGSRMPNFTYMLVHDGLAAREKSWDGFRSDPEWKKLAATPGYADGEILSNITTIFLRPAPYSQI